MISKLLMNDYVIHAMNSVLTLINGNVNLLSTEDMFCLINEDNEVNQMQWLQHVSAGAFSCK